MMPHDSSKHIFEQVKVFSPEVQYYDLAICFAPSCQDSELLYFMVAVDNADSDHHEPLLSCL